MACLSPSGASADEVSALLRELEMEAEQAPRMNDVPAEAVARYLRDSESIRSWVESVTKFGAGSFLAAPKYFVPIPVALVAVEENLLLPVEPNSGG
jgi:hypothetical protein